MTGLRIKTGTRRGSKAALALVVFRQELADRPVAVQALSRRSISAFAALAASGYSPTRRHNVVAAGLKNRLAAFYGDSGAPA
jgi:hypothetical protein